MKRLPTAVAGLDEILSGGLFEGGVYIFEGPPGVGKTTLANQIAYTLAQRDAKTLYVTMLAESHARMLQHMDQQTFFDRSAVNDKVFYISGYRELEDGGLRAVVELLRSELARSRATLLVIDGLVIERSAAGADESVRQFVHEMQILVSAMSCTCLLLTSGNGNALSAEQTMVDGIFSFEDRSFHWRAERRMQVRKFRGCQVIRGQHTFCISTAGLQFFPRLESLPLPDAAGIPGREAAPVGIPRLDAILQNGGLTPGSATVVTGHSGSGKTTLALAYACASTLASPGILFACTESSSELCRIGGALHLAVTEAVDSGALTIENLGHEDESMDQMGHKILRLVDEQKVSRLVVDGLAGLADTLAFPERGYRFLGRLLLELKRRGVTSVFTVDPDALTVAAGTSLANGVVGWFDNAFSFGVAGADGRPSGNRELAIIKVRGQQTAASTVDVRLGTLDTAPPPGH